MKRYRVAKEFDVGRNCMVEDDSGAWCLADEAAELIAKARIEIAPAESPMQVDDGLYMCTCGRYVGSDAMNQFMTGYRLRFCPGCGARMDWPKEEQT